MDELVEEDTVISVKNLNYSYSTSDGRKRPTLYNINLTIKRGSRILLIGPNGAGKVIQFLHVA